MTLLDFIIVNSQGFYFHYFHFICYLLFIYLIFILLLGDRCTLDMIFLNDKLPRLLSMDQYKRHLSTYHCSALIKVPNDWSDLFAGHTTWVKFIIYYYLLLFYFIILFFRVVLSL